MNVKLVEIATLAGFLSRFNQNAVKRMFIYKMGGSIKYNLKKILNNLDIILTFK